MAFNAYLAINLSAVWLDRDNLFTLSGFSHSKHLLSWEKPQALRKGEIPSLLVFMATDWTSQHAPAASGIIALD